MRTLIAAIVGLLVAAPGWAATITYLSDERSVTASELWCDGGHCESRGTTETPAPGALVFDATAALGGARASQNSTLSSTSMSGSNDLSASTAGDAEDCSARSLFLVGFRLDAASPFTLWASSGPIFDTFGTRLELRTAAGDSIYSQSLSEFYDFDESGLLPAGDYVLEIDAHVWSGFGYDFGDSYFDFSLVSVSCGDGSMGGAEECDDSNTAPGDGCDATCRIESGWICAGEPSVCAPCGDGLIESPEACDDGGTTPDDGCSASCQIESGWICVGEPSVCSEDCGDGLVVGSEECDDGGTITGDGCNASCQIESGWICAGEPSVCALCGDGLIESPEACDDGGTTPGDGCSASCQIESRWMCVREPSVCSDNSIATFDWVPVGDPGNAVDTMGGYGDVGYEYRISKYETTNTQYAEFLNAVAADDIYSLYSTAMMDSRYGGITRSGDSGNYTYSAIPGRENKPVNYVSWYDSLRFANWLHNGQPTGAHDSTTTEDGAYTFSGATSVGARNAGATVFLTSEDEWYKAAYYDAPSTSYFSYPAGSDAKTTCAVPGAISNTANCYHAVLDLTNVGSYWNSASPNDTFDQGGNVSEWTETTLLAPIYGPSSIVRGGGFDDSSSYLGYRSARSRTTQFTSIGFRVASIPEPPIEIDIKPWSDTNLIHPFARGVIPVAILGSEDFDVAEVDVTTLGFGPNGAPSVFDLTNPWLYWLAHWDVNHDGQKDLLSYYQTQDTGISLGDTEACLTGETLDGVPIEGCDAIATRLGCGIGFELVLLLPPLLWIRQRRRRARG